MDNEVLIFFISGILSILDTPFQEAEDQCSLDLDHSSLNLYLPGHAGFSAAEIGLHYYAANVGIREKQALILNTYKFLGHFSLSNLRKSDLEISE